MRVIAVTLFLLATGCASSDGATTLRVFAAASLSDAARDLAIQFEADNPSIDVDLNLAASSTLAHQIFEGAPADVFASADQRPMARLVDSGDVTSPPAVFARNRLEIVVPTGNPGRVTGLDDFGLSDPIIGLCVEAAPCGRLARQALGRAGVTPAPDTEEPHVRALLTKIEAGVLDAAIVYRTDRRAAGDRVEHFGIPDDHNVVAHYPIATVASSANPAAADAFVSFVLSPRGQRVLGRYGFLGT